MLKDIFFSRWRQVLNFTQSWGGDGGGSVWQQYVAGLTTNINKTANMEKEDKIERWGQQRPLIRRPKTRQDYKYFRSWVNADGSSEFSFSVSMSQDLTYVFGLKRTHILARNIIVSVRMADYYGDEWMPTYLQKVSFLQQLLRKGVPYHNFCRWFPSAGVSTTFQHDLISFEPCHMYQ